MISRPSAPTSYAFEGAPPAGNSRRHRRRLIGALGLSLGAVFASIGLAGSAATAAPETAAASDRLGYDFVVSDDGVYIWFIDERAVVKDRTLVSGFVQVDGDTAISSVDLATGRRLSQNISMAGWSVADDHANPAILAMENGRIGVFYTGHAKNSQQFSRFSNVGIPTSIDDFGPEQWFRTPGGQATYNNAYQLSGEDNKIFNFFRAGNYTYLMIYDSEGEPLLDAPKQVVSNLFPNWQGRPYLKVASNGVDRIDLLFSNGHPTDPKRDLYHAYFQGGNLYKSDGKLIGNLLEQGPFVLSDATKVYDNKADGNFPDIVKPDKVRDWRPWNHEIKLGADGDPVFVYSRQLGPYELEYWYGSYDSGTKTWTKTKVADAGDSLVPTTPIDPWTGEPIVAGGSQPHYAGGIAINPDDVNEVFISANQNPITNQATPKFEIYRGVRNSGTFSWTAITQDSREDNIRPYVPSGAEYADQVVIWTAGRYDQMQNRYFPPDNHYYQAYDTKIVGRYLHRGFEQTDDHYAIDFNGEHAATPEGYTPLDAAGRTPLVTDRATIQMVNPNGGRERPDVDGELLSDFGFAWRDLDVSVTGLSAGYYNFSLTNYDLLNDQNVAVQFFRTGTDPVTVVESHSQTDPTPASFVAKVDADTDYTLRLHRLGTRASVLNSLEITPLGEQAPPLASFQPASDVEAAVGTTLSFDGSASVDPDGGELTYEWRSTGMPGIPSRGATFERSFDTPGRYGVELTVIDDEGERAKQHINVFVATTLPSQPPVASFEPTSDVDVQIGTSMLFDGVASKDPDGGDLIYQWRSTGIPGVASRESTFERTFDTPGRFGVELTVIDDEGQSAKQHIDVRVSSASSNEATTSSEVAPATSEVVASSEAVASSTPQGAG